ncbi:site-specific integrase [Roseateles sp. BYS87W]|uniref:Site-specific integrase n=1 Tax=Pelomonas baiyunensis TaxID=3299026 RepID=A0ABW7GXL7_9BURK
MTKKRATNKPTPKTVLDKRTVADCTFDAIPVFDASGKQTGTVPNEAQAFYDIHDTHKDAPTGFRLRVNRSVKTYVLVQRVASKVKTVSVGRHPDLLLGAGVAPDRNARLVAAELSARLRRGEDINQTKREERLATQKSEVTLRVLFSRWMADYVASAKRDPRENTIAAVEKAQQRLGHKLLDTPADALTWRDLEVFFVDKATKKGHLTAAEQTIRWVSAVYNKENHRITLDALQAKSQPSLYANPAEIFIKTGALRNNAELERDYDKKGVRRPLSGQREHFRKWLDYVVAARDDLNKSRTGADYMLLTVVLGMRRNETAGLLWNDRLSKAPEPGHALRGYNFIDLDHAVAVLNVTKNRYAHRIPIPGFVLQMLRERRLLVGDSPYVFPRVSRSKLAKAAHYNDPRSFLDEVKKAIKVNFSTHDLRRTFGNIVTEMGLPDRLARQLLNHKSGGVVARYADQSLEQLRPVMEDVEDEMLAYATTSPKPKRERHFKTRSYA